MAINNPMGTPSLHRLGRYRISGPPFDFASQADANSRNPNVAVFVFFLIRPKATAYFTHSANVPNQKLGKWLNSVDRFCN